MDTHYNTHLHFPRRGGSAPMAHDPNCGAEIFCRGADDGRRSASVSFHNLFRRQHRSTLPCSPVASFRRRRLNVWRSKLPTTQRTFIPASEFRARAEECRRRAQTVRDKTAQMRMLRLAADYEHMARHDVFKRWRWLAPRRSLRNPI